MNLTKVLQSDFTSNWKYSWKRSLQDDGICIVQYEQYHVTEIYSQWWSCYLWYHLCLKYASHKPGQLVWHLMSHSSSSLIIMMSHRMTALNEPNKCTKQSGKVGQLFQQSTSTTVLRVLQFLSSFARAATRDSVTERERQSCKTAVNIQINLKCNHKVLFFRELTQHWSWHYILMTSKA